MATRANQLADHLDKLALKHYKKWRRLAEAAITLREQQKYINTVRDAD